MRKCTVVQNSAQLFRPIRSGVSSMSSITGRLSALGAALLLMGILTACGQKGPLYLPESVESDAQQESDEKKSKTAKRG